MATGKKIILCGLIILFLILFISGCELKNPLSPKVESQGALVYFSGCKETETMKVSTSSQDSSLLKKECLTYDFDGNVLRIRHINAALNCCADEVIAEISIEDTIISITPKEIYHKGPCFCTCLCDLDYEIKGLRPGIYSIVIKSFEHPLELNLNQPISGTYCEDRSQSPWTS